MRRITIVAALLLQGASPAPISIYGVTLGMPLNECHGNEAPPPCWEESGIGRGRTDPAAGQSVKIMLPQMPSFAKYPFLAGWMIDGKVEGVTLFATGPASAPEVLEELRGKFGPPDQAEIRKAHNGFGAEFSYPFAAWHRPSATILFDGLVNDVQTSAMSVSSAVLEAARRKQSQENRAAEPKL